MSKLFLQADQEQANKEIDCYGYLLKKAIEHMANGEFGKAAAYHENIARTQIELQKMKDAKKLYVQAKTLLRQIEIRQLEDEILKRFKHDA